MKKILVPTDFSTVADNALHYAVQLATHLKNEIVLFHASSILSDAEEVIFREKILILRASYPMVDIEGVSSPKLFNSQSISELFDPGSLAFIVIGTQGSDATLKHKIFGTNAAEIVEEATCPVIVVPHTASFVQIQKVAFASDNKLLEKELPRVIEFTKAFKAQIHILHIDDSGIQNSDGKAINLRELLNNTAHSNYDLNVTFTTEKPSPGENILSCIEDFVEEKNCELLILFHQNFSGIRRFFHTGVSEKAAENFKFPMVIFQKQENSLNH